MEKSKKVFMIVAIVVISLVFLVALTGAVLMGTGVMTLSDGIKFDFTALKSDEEPAETTAPATEPDTTEPEASEPTAAEPTVNGVSYTVSDEEAINAANEVVATIGDEELTNAELQVYYWMSIYEFISQNQSYIPYMGVDFSQPLDQQVYDSTTGQSWQEAFLDHGLSVWHQYTAVKLWAEASGYTLDELGLAYMEDLDANILEQVTANGHETVDEMLLEAMGAGATYEAYKEYMSAGYYAVCYMTDQQEALTPTMEQMETYFTENADYYSYYGITKDSGDAVDVRHILIMPKGGMTDENNETVYSDEEWETCRLEAQALLDEWKNGEATEVSFGELAKLHSEDPGSASNGGLYSGVTEGYMVETFNDWIFDEARVYGETALVKTDYGYHIMYFVSRDPIWVRQVKSDYLSEKLDAIIQEALDAYPMEKDYEKVVLCEPKSGEE